jgi:hypothetical protein
MLIIEMCAKLYIPFPYRKRQLQKTKHSCTVISIPPSCCIDLNVYYGGREICRVVVQGLSIGTKVRQISPSRKPALSYSVHLARSK